MRPWVMLAGLLMAVPASALNLPDWLALGKGGPAPAPEALRPVVSAIVEDRATATRPIPGEVRAHTQVTMAFQTVGRLVERPVDLGDRVAAGDLLAMLAADDLAARARAAGAALAAAEVQRDIARRTLQRTEALARQRVASAAQFEAAQQAAAAAEAAAGQARSVLVQAEDAQGQARMTAPFAGIVSAVHEQPGAVLAAGAPVLQLSADDEREAVIDLPESALENLPDDAVFTVWRAGDPDRTVPAVLDRIAPVADSATRTRRLYLTLPPDAAFRLGTLIRARLGSTDEPALTVPEAAIFRRGGTPHVWRVRREGGAARVEAVPVVPAGTFNGAVLIERGLAPGDEVVIRGVHSLRDNQRVGLRVQP